MLHLALDILFFFSKLCVLYAGNAWFFFLGANDVICILLSDGIIVTGVLSAKWSSVLKDVRCDLDPVLIANHVR